MKILDILTEAKLQPKDFYQEVRLEALIYMLEKKQPFTMLDGKKQVILATPKEIKYLKSLRAYYDAGGKSQDVKDVIPREIGGVKLNTIFKSEEFGGIGGNVGGDVPAGGVIKSGIGEVVEAMKAAAIFTKLTSRSKPTITDQDVINNLHALGKNYEEITDGKKVSLLGSISKNVPDLNGNVKDKISLEINLARAPFQRSVAIVPEDTDARGRLKGIVNYVNSEGDLAKYSRFFANNQRRDPVDVAVKGLAGAKTDVETTYTDPSGNIRPLSHLSMSIKAGSAKYDQASGLNEAGNIKFFNTLGLSIDDARDAMKIAKFKNDLDFEKRVKAVVKLYTQAAHMLDAKLSPMSNRGEANFITSVLANLKKSIQGDQKLVYVNFDANGTYYKLNPQLIDNLAKHVELEAKMVMKTWPYLYVYDKNSGKNVFHARLQVNSTGRLTHVFELDHLLDLVKDATNALNTRPEADVPAAKPVQAKPASKSKAVAKPLPQAEPVPMPSTTTSIAPAGSFDDEEDDVPPSTRGRTRKASVAVESK